MIVVDTAIDLAAHAGQPLGVSDWLTIDQARITAFAEICGDDHWIHVDTERAARDMPGGRTIAHGLLLVSLIPMLQRQIYTIRKRGRGLNYGYDRIRFVSPVQENARIRLELALVAAEAGEQGTRIVTDQTIAIEDSDRPAVVARHILLILND